MNNTNMSYPHISLLKDNGGNYLIIYKVGDSLYELYGAAVSSGEYTISPLVAGCVSHIDEVFSFLTNYTKAPVYLNGVVYCDMNNESCKQDFELYKSISSDDFLAFTQCRKACKDVELKDFSSCNQELVDRNIPILSEEDIKEAFTLNNFKFLKQFYEKPVMPLSKFTLVNHLPTAPTNVDINKYPHYLSVEMMAKEVEGITLTKAQECVLRKLKADLLNGGNIITLAGPPGDGKTTIIFKALVELNQPIIYGQLAANATVETFTGGIVLDESGNPYKTKGLLVEACELGLILFVDEANHGNAQTYEPMQSFNQPPYAITTGTRVIKVPEGISIILAFNPGIKNGYTFSSPQTSRFKHIPVSDLPHDDKVKIGISHFKSEYQKLANVVITSDQGLVDNFVEAVVTFTEECEEQTRRLGCIDHYYSLREVKSFIQDYIDNTSADLEGYESSIEDLIDANYFYRLDCLTKSRDDIDTLRQMLSTQITNLVNVIEPISFTQAFAFPSADDIEVTEEDLNAVDATLVSDIEQSIESRDAALSSDEQELETFFGQLSASSFANTLVKGGEDNA